MQGHYVPKFLLKSFANREGMIYEYRKATDEIKHIPPKKAFTVRDLYVQEHRKINDRYFTEKQLQKFESKVSNITNRIKKFSRSKKDIVLTPKERKLLWCFCFTSTLRNPEVHELIKTASSFYYSFINEMKADPIQKKLYDSIFAETLCDNLFNCLNAPENPSLGISIGCIDAARRGFIVGMIGSYRLSEFWFPISSYIAICSNRFGSEENRVFSQAEVDKINNAIFMDSPIVGARCVDWIEFARRK